MANTRVSDVPDCAIGGCVGGFGKADEDFPVQRRASRRTRVSTANRNRGKAPWILVVEDDPDISELLLVLFDSDGLRAVSVADAEAALDMAGNDHPDVITLDISLPGRDGHQLLHDLKGKPSTRNIPVIVVSACSDRLCPDDDRLLAAVVDKPFDLGELLNLAHRSLSAHTV